MRDFLDSMLKQQLIQEAESARFKAYAPYSKFRVGAALLDQKGRVFTGCNVENAAYAEAICAERTAVAKAVSEGSQKFTAIAIVTENGAAPCGSCRQVINEFAPKIDIILVDAKNNVKEFTLDQLLPLSFGPDHLKK